MKKLFKLTALASAVFLLGACADETVLNPEQAREAAPESNAIQFGTYMGKSTMTRAGQAGSYDTKFLQGFKHDGTGWTEGQAQDQGFGVFGYYTGTYTYGGHQAATYTGEGTKDGSENKAANFMFNQLVWWNNDLGEDFITRWTYTPIKYWPNEVQSGRVDDQDNDAANNTATTDYTKGGNVSFFAYAPYVDAAISATTSGITAINSATTLAGANVKTGDPILTYVVAADGKDIVDLLWGTYKGTSTNVNQTGNQGVTGTTNAGPGPSSATTYAAEILKDYTTNADLTKQKTNGTVGFAFKHALAKVGGSTTNPDPSNTDVKNGLMVVLDIDDMKGAEVGGGKDATTKVTVRTVTIKAKSLVDDGSKHPGEDGYTRTYLKKAQGDLNLATGTWAILKTENTVNAEPYTGAAETTATINQSGSSASGKLNTTIAEPASAPDKTAAGFSGLVEGVLTTPKNVYADETAPLVFVPGTYPELTISIDYIVRTADDNLKDHYSEVEQIITKKLTFTSPVELNKQYSILMHLGLTSVKFTAEVSDWDVADATKNFDSDNDGVDDIQVEDVWLPINVAGLRTTYSATEVASNVSTLTLSTATLWDYATKTETDVKSSVILTVSNHAPAWQGSPWLKAADTPDNTVILTANTTFTDRTADITATYTVGTNNITNVTPITQKGRIAEKAKVTFTGIADITTAVKAGESKTYTAIAVTADGKESDGSTAIGSFAAVNENEIGSIVFKDNNGVAVSWITYNKATKTITIAPNTTGAAREANMFIYVGGKLVPVKSNDDSAQIKLTQAA